MYYLLSEQAFSQVGKFLGVCLIAQVVVKVPQGLNYYRVIRNILISSFQNFYGFFINLVLLGTQLIVLFFLSRIQRVRELVYLFVYLLFFIEVPIEARFI